MFGHHHLLSAGAQIEGVVLEASPAPLVRTKDRLRVGVKFDDGETAEFTEDITNYYEPPAHNLNGLIGNAGGDNVIPVSLIAGSKVPVRYDTGDRTKLAIDVPALHERAMNHWSDYKAATRAQAEATLAGQPSDSPAGYRHQSVSSADAYDVTPELTELADLHRRGELTDEEFAAAKRKLLGE